MVLCDVCAPLDLRALLLRSLRSKEREPEDRLPGDPDVDSSGSDNSDSNDRESYNSDSSGSSAEDTWRPGFHPHLPRCFRHHESLIALRASAESGCDLCSLFWATWCEGFAAQDNSLPTDESLSGYFGGPLYIDLTPWQEGTDGRPGLSLSIYPSHKKKRSYESSVNVCTVEAYATRGRFPLDRLDLVNLLLKDVPQDRASPESLAIGTHWLTTCLEQHRRCHRTLEDQRPLPTRVIDVGTDSNNPSLFVSDIGQTGRWAVLSYCWGGNSEFILTEKSFSKFRSGIPLGEFPPTIQDAIIITRSLGLQYLWVDAVCILQDSRDDWAIQSAEMGSVYANACVAIVAAGSPNTKSGILGLRDSPPSCNLPWRIPNTKPGMEDSSQGLYASEEQSVYLRPGEKLWDDLQTDSTLDGRGWTYQESLFAMRRLVYTHGQTIWECMTWQETEAGGVKLDREGLIKNNPHTTFLEFKALPAKFATFEDKRNPELMEEAFALWYTLITRYSQRNLTYETDRLAAIAGLARYFHEATGCKYFAGLWEDDMLRGLLWKSLGDGENLPTEYIAPSWSWAAHGSKIITNRTSLADAKTLASIKHIKVDYVFPTNPFGPIKSAELTIHAPSCQLPSTIFTNTSSASMDESSSAFASFVTLYYAHAPSEASRRQPFWHPGQHFVALQIAHTPEVGAHRAAIELLFLESLNRDSKSAAAWKGDDTALVCRRVGRCSIRDAAPDEFLPEDYALLAAAESAAYRELVEEEWAARDVVIV